MGPHGLPSPIRLWDTQTSIKTKKQLDCWVLRPLKCFHGHVSPNSHLNHDQNHLENF